MSSAFASLLQARPCPVFGRPIHLWGSPLDYGPVLLLMPFGFHLAVDTLPSGELQNGGSRFTLAVSGFRLRARLGFSIPVSSPRPARHYPRVRIRRPSSGRRRDLNPPDHHAAQRTLRAPPPPSRRRPTSRWCRLYGLPSFRGFRRGTRRASPVARCVLVAVLSLTTPPE